MENRSTSPPRRGCKPVLARLAFFGRPYSWGGRGPGEFSLALPDHGEGLPGKKTLARGSGADKVFFPGSGCFCDSDPNPGVRRRFSGRHFNAGFGDFVRSGPKRLPGLDLGDPAPAGDFFRNRQGRCFNNKSAKG